MLIMFSRGFKDIVTKTAFFKEFPGLENKFQNSRGFKEIKDPYEPCLYSPLSGEFAANIFFYIRKDIRHSVRAALETPMTPSQSLTSGTPASSFL